MKEYSLSIKYIPSLDGIRAISVFIVLVSHAGLGHIIPGGLGVTVFFFLSGFLITTLLIEEYEKKCSINVPNFFARRFLRLFPPLAVSSGIAYTLFYFGFLNGGASWSGFLSQMLYFANYHQIFKFGGEIPEGTEVLWSLAVEEHFYLVFPVFILVCFRFLGNKRIPWVLAGISLIVFLWRVYLVIFKHVPPLRTYYATDTRIDSIIFGSLFAFISNPVKKQPCSNLLLKDYLLLIVGVIALLFSLLYRSDAFRQTWRYSLQGIALMPIFYYAVNRYQNPIFKWLNWEWVRKLGIYSYFIYLIHHVIIKGLQKYLYFKENIYALILTTTLASVFFAFIMDEYFDIYFKTLRKKFRHDSYQPSLASNTAVNPYTSVNY